MRSSKIVCFVEKSWLQVSKDSFQDHSSRNATRRMKRTIGRGRLGDKNTERKLKAKGRAKTRMDGPVPIALSDAGVATPLHSRCFTAAFWKTRRRRDSFLPENGRVPTGQTAAVYSIAVFSGPATYSAIFASWKVGKKMTSLSLSLSLDFLLEFEATLLPVRWFESTKLFELS